MSQNNTQFKLIYERAPFGIYQFSGNGKVLIANPFFLKMLGFDSIDELNQVGLENLFIQPNYNELKKIVVHDILTSNFESDWKKKNGELIIIKQNVQAIFDSDNKLAYYEGFVEDITEHKIKEQSIVKDGIFNQWLFDSSLIPILLMEYESAKFIELNKAALKIFGFKLREELLGKTPYDISPEKQYDGISSEEKANSYLDLALKEGSVTFEWLHQKPNGELWDAEIHLLSFQSERKALLQVSAVDITERKAAERGLRESKQLFETLAHASPVGIFRTRPDGYTTYVNPKWTELSGLSFDEAIGNGWFNAVHPDDRDLLRRNWEEHSAKGKESSANYRFINSNGGIVWVLGRAVPEIVDDKIIGYVGTITDISELKIAEEVLKESEERYRTIIEAFPDIIMISDLEKNIVFANDALGKITGIKPEDYTNADRKAGIHPDDNPMVQKAIVDLLKSDKSHTNLIENRFIDAWGKIHWFRGIISKLELDNQILLQTITRDITQSKLAEKELEEYRNNLEVLVENRTEELAATNEKLKSTNEELLSQREELESALQNLKVTQNQLIQSEKMASLGILSSGIAHEINNPLNFIKAGVFGITQYLRNSLQEHLPRLLPLLDGVNTGIDRATNIVVSLNHYSRQSDSETTNCDIHSVIDNCLVMLQSLLKNRIKLVRNYTNKSYLLMCNEGKLHQAFLNILSNAAQSIPAKGKIEITTQLKNQNLNILISDTGAGIKDEDLVKIFDPFFTTKEVGQGTGLGLSITYNIITEHKGTINIHSEPGKGTEVRIELPVVEAN